MAKSQVGQKKAKSHAKSRASKGKPKSQGNQGRPTPQGSEAQRKTQAGPGQRKPSGGEEKPTNLEHLLDKLEGAPDERHEAVTLGEIVEAAGARSFGPLLLVAGLVAASPLSAIPGMPTTLGVLVALITVQFLFRRRHFWLPQWLLKRRLKRETFCKALAWMRKPAHFIDRFLHPRLESVTRHTGLYAIALVCALIGIAMPSLELVPFSSHVAGLALTAFGLALIANDGVVGLVALGITGAAVAVAAVMSLS